METEKKRTKKQPADHRERLVTAFLDQLLTEGKHPASVYKFCKDLDLPESTFYEHFASFEAIEQNIWLNFLQHTSQRLQADESWAAFNSREKMLALYFTLFEEFKQSRSYILLKTTAINRFEVIPGYIKLFKSAFESFVGEILTQGKGLGEISARPYLDSRYPQLFWLHFVFLLFYWRDDTSASFEQTDAAIEKSVNLAFDVIGKGAFDSAIDFAKFLFQTKFPDLSGSK